MFYFVTVTDRVADVCLVRCSQADQSSQETAIKINYESYSTSVELQQKKICLVGEIYLVLKVLILHHIPRLCQHAFESKPIIPVSLTCPNT